MVLSFSFVLEILKMKFRGGYNVFPNGRPDDQLVVLPDPDVLYMPLKNGRLSFSELCVADNDTVAGGDVLAKDPENFDIPMLAPRAGTVRIDSEKGHILLENISRDQEQWHADNEELQHIEQKVGAGGLKRYKLLSLGAWEFFTEAFSDRLPDPLLTPQAVIVSTISLEPFLVRGDVQLKEKLLQFTRGLEHLQSLLEYQPMYLVMPHLRSDFAKLVREKIRGYAWVNLIEIPLKYPFDNFNILARKIGLKSADGPIWAIRTEGVLAVDQALTSTKPCTDRLISVAGSAANHPTTVQVPVGFPIEDIKEKFTSSPDVRLVDGGMLTGRTIDENTLGVNSQCRGITICPEHLEREFLGFVRPGLGRRSYSPSFLSALRSPFSEKITTQIYGEVRPCIACNFCEEVCPAGIMPHLIHKYLYSDLIEEADRARVGLCIRCGLCSYVCTSKIELTSQFIDAQIEIEKEKAEALKEAQKNAEAEKEAQKKN